MNAAKINSALGRMGRDAVLLREDGPSPAFAASIQPRTALTGDAGPLGVGRRRLYTLFAPPGLGIRDGLRLVSDKKTYLILAAEEWALSGEALYTWGILALEGEDDS